MKTIAALALALAWTFASAAPAAWAAHGGGHAASEPSVFPRPVDPWRNWPPPSRHFHGQQQRVPSSVIVIVPAPAAVWVPNQWAWNGFQWVWVPGHWTW